MKIKLMPLSILALLLVFALCGASRSAGPVLAQDEPQSIPGNQEVLRYDPVPNSWKVAPPPGVPALGQAPARADALPIAVAYNVPASCPAVHPLDPNPANPTWLRQPWPDDAVAAMYQATLIWSTLLNGQRLVVVHACWYATLGSSVLGQAGPNGIGWQNFNNAPQSDTLYPVALANQLANSDLNGGAPEINASFSAGFTWYFGLDGNIPKDEFGDATATDFLSVALHELGHGLGFSGRGNWDNGVAPNECNGFANWGCVGNPPQAYDRLVQSGGTNIVGGFTNPSAALGAALVGNNLFFNGNDAVSANGNNPPRLFAPNPWRGGSSYLHLDEDTFDKTVNALMTPDLADGEALHHPGPVGLGLLADIGWSVNSNLIVFVNRAHSGFEDGSAFTPYNTVQEGVAAVHPTGIVWISAGNYNERLTIHRPMTLQVTGNSGVVRIGN
jgi:hypothetical protein